LVLIDYLYPSVLQIEMLFSGAEIEAFVEDVELSWCQVGAGEVRN